MITNRMLFNLYESVNESFNTYLKDQIQSNAYKLGYNVSAMNTFIINNRAHISEEEYVEVSAIIDKINNFVETSMDESTE